MTDPVDAWIDGRLAEEVRGTDTLHETLAITLSNTGGDLSDRFVLSLLRAAYARGYCDALIEPEPPSGLAAHVRRESARLYATLPSR